MLNVRVSSTRKQYNNYHVSSQQNMERELQIKSQLLDGTQESFTATVSKLSMIEQELEMLKIDQYGKIDSYHRQSSTSSSSLYPYLQSQTDDEVPHTPLLSPHSTLPHRNRHEEKAQHPEQHQSEDCDQNSRLFLSQFATPSFTDTDDVFNHSHNNLYTSNETNPNRHHGHHETSSHHQQQHHLNFHSNGYSQYNLPAPRDAYDSLLSHSEAKAQQSATQQHPTHRQQPPQPLHQQHSSQAEELLQRFQQITLSAQGQNQYPLGAGQKDETGGVAAGEVSDAEVALMQSELARTCKRENVMQEEHRQACLALQESWEKLTRLRKHIAECRGAIEETTIEDIHHQTDQWQLNTYRENNAPSSAHMLKHYGVSRSGMTSLGPSQLTLRDAPRSRAGTESSTGTGAAGANTGSGDQELTSLLLGLNEEEPESDSTPHSPETKHDISAIPYIDHKSNTPAQPHREAKREEEEEEERVAAESRRIIHLQVLREKVRMRDALRSELATLEERLNQTRRELDEASSLLISASQVAVKQRGAGTMSEVSKSAREKVQSLTATLSSTEASYLSLTQQQLTIETELRASLEDMHLKQQQGKIGERSELSLLTEDECDRLIRESQSAMAAKTGIFSWSKNPTQAAERQKQVDKAAALALGQTLNTETNSTALTTGSRGGRTTNLTLDEILNGKAKLTRMNGEKAASFRSRLQKRLAGMLVVLGQVQAEVDEKTMTVKVARERLRECEVKRLRLELQMAHIGSILQNKRDTAKKLREERDYGADKPDVLRDERPYHRHKSEQTFHSTSAVHTKHQPTTGNGYTPNGQSHPFHISELDSSEEHKSSPYSNGLNATGRTGPQSPPKKVVSKDDELRDKTKLMMSLAGNLLHSEYAKDLTLTMNDTSSDEEDNEDATVKDKAAKNEDTNTGRMSPLQKAIHNTGDKLAQTGKENNAVSTQDQAEDQTDKGQSKGQGKGPSSPGRFKAKRIPSTAAVTTEKAAVKGGSGVGRAAALSSGFVPHPPPVVTETTVNDDDNLQDKAAADVPAVDKTALTSDSANGKLKDKSKKKKVLDSKTGKDPSRPPSPPPLQVVYDRDGRKLLRTKSGTLIHSRELERIQKTKKSGTGTGRYSIDATIHRQSKDSSEDPSSRIKGDTNSKIPAVTTLDGKIGGEGGADAGAGDETGSLVALMGHLESVASSVVEEEDVRQIQKQQRRQRQKDRHPVRTANADHKPAGDSSGASSKHSQGGKPKKHGLDEAQKKILWQEAMIRELLVIILNQTETSSDARKKNSHEDEGGDDRRITRRDGQPQGRVRSNSMDSHCTDYDLNPPPSISNLSTPLPNYGTPNSHQSTDEQISKYQAVLHGVKTQELIDLLYTQQRQLKKAQMENELHKLEKIEAKKQLHKKQHQHIAEDGLSPDSTPDENATSELTISEKDKQMETGDEVIDEKLVPEVEEKEEEDEGIEDGADDKDGAYTTYTDLYLAVSKQKQQEKQQYDQPPQQQPQQQQQEQVNRTEQTQQPQHAHPQAHDQHKSKQQKKQKHLRQEKETTEPIHHATSHNNTTPPRPTAQTYSDPTPLSPYSQTFYSQPPPFDSVDPASLSPFSESHLSEFLATAMPTEVQDKHQQLTSERTELPDPPPKEFNVYSKQMSELDSLTIQLQKWTEKLNDLTSSTSLDKSVVPSARLDVTVLTARYLPEMKKISSMLQSSLYAEMTIESINPYGFEDAQQRWREASRSSGMGRADDDDTTISDISDGDELNTDENGGSRSDDPEEALGLVRQRTLTQWNMKLPDWRTDPLSVTFPCDRQRHRQRQRHSPGKSKKSDKSYDDLGVDEVYFKYLLSSYVVYVTIWSASRSGLDELVARGALPLTALADQKKHSYWLQLRYPSDVYQSVRSRSKVPDGCSVRIDARLMHSKKLFFLAKISETQEKINILARRKPPTTVNIPPRPSPVSHPPRTTTNNTSPAPTRPSSYHKPTTVKFSMAPLPPVKKVAPYIPAGSSATKTNSKNSASKTLQKSPQKVVQRKSTNKPTSTQAASSASHPPQKKRKSDTAATTTTAPQPTIDTTDVSATMLPLTESTLAALQSPTHPDSSSITVSSLSASPGGGGPSGEPAQTNMPPPPRPNLSIFRGAGVRMREERARDAKKRSSEEALGRRGFGSGVDKMQGIGRKRK